jgi:hypothetical protein
MTDGRLSRRLEINDMLRRAIVTLMIAGFATLAAADIVYKWVDSTGQVHYSDLPPSESGAKLLGTIERNIVLGEIGDSADTTDSAPPADDGVDAPPADTYSTADAAAAVRRDVEQVRLAECKQAQERYKIYISSQRLYRDVGNGKREYLTDAELSAARIQAKQAVDDLCK